MSNAARSTARRAIERAPRRPVETAPRRSHLRVVRADEGRRFRPGRLGSGAVIGALIVLLTLAAVQALVVQRQLEIDEIERVIAERETVRDRLRTDVALLESPDRVVTAALELGLVRPETVVFIDPVSPVDGSIPVGPETSDRPADASVQAQAP